MPDGSLGVSVTEVVVGGTAEGVAGTFHSVELCKREYVAWTLGFWQHRSFIARQTILSSRGRNRPDGESTVLIGCVAVSARGAAGFYYRNFRLTV